MKNKTEIDNIIAALPFPTPKNVIWQLKQKKIKASQEETQYIWDSVQHVLESKLMTLTNPAQIGSIQKFLMKNFDDWDPTVVPVHEDQRVNITINTSNSSENKI